MLFNFLVNTKAYRFTSLGTTPSNLNSTLCAWESVNFCWYRKWKTYKLYPISRTPVFEDLKSSSVYMVEGYHLLLKL